jgi:RNA polymerase sigma factor (sigma-70 family)
VFRPLDQTALQQLDDDALVEHMRRAREAGHPSAALALAILVYGHWHNVLRRVRLKVPEPYAEDLAGDIVADAISSAFDGTSVGQFRSWLGTITQRAIADHYRRGPGRAPGEPLEGPDADRELASPEDGAVEVRDAIDRVMATLNPDHRRVVDIFVFDGRPAREAAAEVPGMSEANVHQIASRFRAALRRELDT